MMFAGWVNRHQLDVIDYLRKQNRVLEANQLGYPNIEMLRGAGHDAMNAGHVVPTSKIFVPCKNCLSHNEAESALPEDLATGSHTLLHTLPSRAGVA